MNSIVKLNITVISGTNRKGSYSIKLARHIQKLMEVNGHTTQVLDLAKLPVCVFDGASYEQQPAEFDRWQQDVLEANAVIICVPEYNRGIPGILKYFMDLLKYPDSFQNKSVALVGLSAGLSGGIPALREMTNLLNFLKAGVYSPGTCIPKCHNMFSQENIIRNYEFYELLVNYLGKFERHVLCKINNFH